MQTQQLLFIGLMILAFYFVLIRPQQKRMRGQRQLLSSIEVGDEVITIGGLFGRVRSMEEGVVHLEVADGMVIRLAKQAISRKISPEEPEPLEESDGSAGQAE